MTWVVSRVEADDFMSYHRLDLDLAALPAVTLILGSRGSGRSNGSGKSTLFEVITWTLYGDTCRKLASVEKVIRRGASKCTCRVTVTISDGRKLVVERSRSTKGVSLRVLGVDGASTAAGTQAMINAIVGDRSSFLSTAMFSGVMSSFCRLPDATRKELLERMAGCGDFSAAADLAKTRLDSANAKMEQLESECLRAQTQFDNAVRRKLSLASESMFQRSRLIDAYLLAKEEAILASDAVREAYADVRAWLDGANAARAEAELLRAQHQRDSEDAQAEIDHIDAQIAKIASNTQTLKATIRSTREEIESITNGTHPDVCPKCGQVWPHDHSVEEHARVLKAAQDNLFNLRVQLAPLESQLPTLREAREDFVRKRQESLRLAMTTQASCDERHYRTLVHKLAQLESTLEAKQDACVAAGDAVPEEPVISADYKLACDAVDDAQEQLRVAADAVQSGKDDVRRLQFWRRGFSKTGLPSFLVDGSIPDMNDVVHDVAQSLTDGELSVSFNPAAARGTQSVLAVDVDYANGGTGFDASSHGEQTRVDVAVLFALRDLATRRSSNPCGQLFLDEIMDGTDEHFANAFMSLLRSRYKHLQVLLISHDPAIASLCDKTLVVTKSESVSVLSTA